MFCLRCRCLEPKQVEVQTSVASYTWYTSLWDTIWVPMPQPVFLPNLPCLLLAVCCMEYPYLEGRLCIPQLQVECADTWRREGDLNFLKFRLKRILLSFTEASFSRTQILGARKLRWWNCPTSHVVQTTKAGKSRLLVPRGIWLTWEGMAWQGDLDSFGIYLGEAEVNLKPPFSSHFTSSLLEGNLASTKPLMFGATLNRIDRLFSTSAVNCNFCSKCMTMNNCWHWVCN